MDNNLSIRITDHNTGFDQTIEVGNAANSEPFLSEQRPLAIATGSGISPVLEWSDTLCDGERVTHAAAEKACAALGDGWRLPTRMELESILDLTRHDPAIDTERFPDTQSGAYWTSTPCAWASSCAWIVNFYYGGASGNRRDNDLGFVRAVRSVSAGQ